MNPRIVPGQVAQLSPRVRRVTQNNPGIMTGPGTNTYLIGRESLFIIDPGENTDEHFAALTGAIGSCRVLGIAPSHAHPDHWPLAPRLAAALGAPTFGFKAHNGYEPMRILSDGNVVDGGEWRLQVIYTPGHISDHLSYLLFQERALFTGDHVMAWSTSVISRPDGNLNSYMSSLDRLRTLDIAVMFPAHGAPIYDAQGRVEELIAHRKMRSAQVIEGIRAGLDTLPALLKHIYADVDTKLHGAAQQSLLAHIDALVESGQIVVRREGVAPRTLRYALAV